MPPPSRARRPAAPSRRCGRARSAFWRAGQPLLVAECFLPAFWSLARAPVAPR
ncbi:hypothetical protein L560_2034 [Bordetella pertussis STO1-CHOC-0018]|nr:hypothetical protein L560_2034 [Bordetella pertussis STO1-CHOC-0018]